MIATPFSSRDAEHMAHALRLAELGMHTTQPNPRVGCVIAQGGKLLGTGWHRRAGEDHAEVIALREAGAQARGATAYVTLEPCGLHGRTPPCADALIEAGVARVVVASADASQRHGGALARLGEAGIAVESGLMTQAARELNRGFLSRIERGRPWLRIKLAMSLDGRTALASGESKWITGAAARADVQRWRARSSAILTGIGTVLADDPQLTVRGEQATRDERVAPLRVVLDSHARMPAGAQVLDAAAPTLLIHATGARSAHVLPSHVQCAEVEIAGGRLDLHAVLALLAARGCNEVQVEAGASVCGALFAQDLVDELLLYVAPVLLGDHALPLLALPAIETMAQRTALRVIDQRQVGEDWRLLLRPVESC